MIVDECSTSDPDRWAPAAAQEFTQRWTQDREADIDEFIALGGLDNGQVNVDELKILQACARCKKPYRIDAEGVCVKAIQIAIPIMPQITDLVGRTFEL